MREILFKGKSLLSGEWVEGYYIGPIGVLDVHEICDIHDITGTRVEVDPSTVCQYTGMTDKNGTKIFEGDIVECLGGEYYSGHYEISAIAQIEDIRDMAMYNFLNAEKIEVIGNIHDSPELLEVG